MIRGAEAIVSADPAFVRRPASLSVVMPVFNEAATVGRICELVLRQSCVAELIIVDDCSTDTSWNEIVMLAGNPRVKALKHTKNKGKGAGIQTALAAVTAPVVVVQDADLEYNPDDLPMMLHAMEVANADVVYGSRFSQGAQSETKWWHELGNRALTFASNLLTGLRLTDEATCYKMFRRELLSRVTLEEDRFGFCAEFTAKISRLQIRIVEVPIRYHARGRADGKKIRLRDGFSAVRCLIRYGLLPRLGRAAKPRVSQAKRRRGAGKSLR